MQSPRRPLRGPLVTGVVSLALALSAVLVPPGPASQVSAATYAGYTEGQAIARYDTVSGWTGSLAAPHTEAATARPPRPARRGSPRLPPPPPPRPGPFLRPIPVKAAQR